MLSDRSYMRDSYGRPATTFLLWLICGTIAGFIVQNIFDRWFHVTAFERLLALSVAGAKSGHLWTFLTYPLLHGGPLHLLFNCLTIFFIGRELQPLLGDRRLAVLSASAAALGGLLWFATNFNRADSVIGASGIAMALFTVYACIYPRREMSFLLFFVVPVTVQPIWLLAVIGGIDLFGFLFAELPGSSLSGYVAHSAHLGGILAGWLYFRYMHQREWKTPDNRTEIELPTWFRKTQKAETPNPAFKVNVSSRADLRAEVDRILDKINSQGFQALTAEERRLLDEAKDSLSKR